LGFASLFNTTKILHCISDESVWTWYAGVSGNVLIDENADRVYSYNVWNYAEGDDLYYNSMLVDLTQPPDKVSELLPQRLAASFPRDVRLLPNSFKNAKLIERSSAYFDVITELMSTNEKTCRIKTSADRFDGNCMQWKCK